MTNYAQFQAGAKTRHDYADMIQVRYHHPNGEIFDAWVSGEEVMSRLNTQDRERLIKGFSRKNWTEAKEALRQEVEKGKEKAKHTLKERLADTVQDQLGKNIFTDSLADTIRGVEDDQEPHEREKAMWQGRLRDGEFRRIVLELAWINLEGTMPDEADPAVTDDWV